MVPAISGTTTLVNVSVFWIRLDTSAQQVINQTLRIASALKYAKSKLMNALSTDQTTS